MREWMSLLGTVLEVPYSLYGHAMFNILELLGGVIDDHNQTHWFLAGLYGGHLADLWGRKG